MQIDKTRSAGMSGTTPGITFIGAFNRDASDLFVSLHLPDGIDTKPEILRPYIDYAERRLIWEYLRVHGRLPACNSE